MNKWEDPFRKSSTENNSNTICHCLSNQGLFIPNRQLSAIVALLLLLAFAIFMVGYFLGKKKNVEQFTEKVQQEAFADQIYTNMLSSAQDELFINNSLPTTLDNNIPFAESINQNTVDQAIIKTLSSNTNIEDIAEKIQEQHYYAQLIGFNTEKAAQLFVKKLLAKGIETEIKKRVSKTVKGQTSYWYQVVTSTYPRKDDLLAVVNKIAKEENIKGICVCSC